MNLSNEAKAREILARSPWCSQQDALKAWDEAVALLNASPEPWTGEGLPPVGIEIEAMMQGLSSSGTYAWRRALVVHGPLPDSKGEVLVFDVETTRPAWVDEFRPVRTPEQIAAQVRSDAIREMIRVWGVAPTGVEYNFAHERAAQLYDAGYHKQQEP